MLKTFRYLRNKPVDVVFRNEDAMGGGIASREPKMVLLFLDIDCLWAAFKWQWSGQVVIVPASDIACMTSDREEPS